MSGVRLHHPNRDYWGKRLVIEVQRNYVAPRLCEDCDEVHLHKTYHLTLDDGGNVIVSEGVLNGMGKAVPPLAGFLVANEVPDPPSQQLWTPIVYAHQRVHHRLTKER